MTSKIVALIQSCKDCPNRLYDSGGLYLCEKVSSSAHLRSDCAIPPWCPLADYPSAAMIQMTESMEVLRQENAQSHAQVQRLAAIVHKYEPGACAMLNQ